MQTIPHIPNEYAKLKKVVLGTHLGFETVDDLLQCYDPVSKHFVSKGEYPQAHQVESAFEEIESVFRKYGVEVYRPQPKEISNYVFSRDVTFVIEDKMFVANMIAEREHELHALEQIFEMVKPEHVVKVDPEVRFEGGDVMVHNEYIFVGYAEQADFDTYKTSRTNKAGVEYLAKQFSDKTVIGFELTKSDDDHIQNVLHLDCCMQPVGNGKYVLINPQGFKNKEDLKKIYDIFGVENCIEVTPEEGSMLMTNLLSIEPNVVISDKRFTRVNQELSKRGIQVEEVNYEPISRMGGLFRCTTMPLERA